MPFNVGGQILTTTQVKYFNDTTIVRSGLVLYLDAGLVNSYSGTGTTWTDLSGNGRNATLTNGPTFSSANGGLIDFDGTDDYAIHSEIDTGTVGSWGVWINYDALSDGAVVLGANIANYYMLFYAGISKLFAINYGGVSGGNLSYPAGLSTGVWYHIWYTRSGNTHTVYLNGTSIGTMSAGDANTCKFRLVGAERTSIYFANAKIANVGVYNRTLSSSEILQNYQAQRVRFGV